MSEKCACGCDPKVLATVSCRACIDAGESDVKTTTVYSARAGVAAVFCANCGRAIIDIGVDIITDKTAFATIDDIYEWAKRESEHGVDLGSIQMANEKPC